MITRKRSLRRRPELYAGFSTIDNSCARRCRKRMKRMKSRMKKYVLNFALLVLAVALTNVAVVKASDQSDVRNTVQSVFEQLKLQNYGALYDLLPGASRNRMSRDRFVSALQRAQGFYELDRLEIGAIKVAGNLAVVDTVLYGRVVNPIQAEGKIVVQQYLLREDGKWRVATGDQSSVKKFIAENPSFGKRFKIQQPRIYVKQGDKWAEFNPPRGNRR